MNDTEEAQRREVALFRYRLIADLAHQPPGAVGIGEQLRAKAAQTYDIPGTLRTSVAAETLRDWLHAYRLGGFDALSRAPPGTAFNAGPSARVVTAPGRQFTPLPSEFRALGGGHAPACGPALRRSSMLLRSRPRPSTADARR